MGKHVVDYLYACPVCMDVQDASIDVPEFRSVNEQYIDSKLDRGHLAAAANWRHNPALMKSTFSLMNISPQEGEGFNRSYWARYCTEALRDR